MDPYIQTFTTETIKTNIAHSVPECQQMLQHDSKNDLVIYHSNIRSIAKNIDELKILLHQFSSLK